MNCQRCGKPLNPEAAFCMHCGLPRAQVNASQSMQASPHLAQHKKDNRPWLYAGGAFLLALLIFLGLYGAGLFGQTAQVTPPPVQVQAAQTPPPLDVQAEQTVMPEEIRQYLLHLEQIEKRKIELTQRQMSEMLVLMGQLKAGGGLLGALGMEDEDYQTPTQTAQTEFVDLQPEWDQLITDFLMYGAPDECQPLASDYYRALNEVPAMTGDIARILNNPGDPSALQSLMEMQNKSTDVVDKYFESSDQKLGEICAKYETTKWFDIKSDVGSNILGKVGF